MGAQTKIGYRNPPVATRFKKGQSGNPKGRKKGSRSIASMVQAALGETVVVNIGGKRKTVSKLEAAFIQQSNKAAAGDPKAVKLMLDIMVGAEARDGVKDGGETVTAEDRRVRNAQLIAALKARLGNGGGNDGQ